MGAWGVKAFESDNAYDVVDIFEDNDMTGSQFVAWCEKTIMDKLECYRFDNDDYAQLSIAIELINSAINDTELEDRRMRIMFKPTARQKQQLVDLKDLALEAISHLMTERGENFANSWFEDARVEYFEYLDDLKKKLLD